MKPEKANPSLPVITTSIPAELKALSNWVCWKIVTRDGKPTKLPVNPNTGNPADSSNPATWSDYETALRYFETYKNNGLAGIGFELSNSPFAGVDLDDCRDPESGAVELWAKEIVERADSYSGVSPSGKGIKIFVKGSLPPGRRRKGKVEMYDEGRYFTVTGARLPDRPETVNGRTAQLAAIHAQHIGQDEPPKISEKPSAPVDASDEELLRLMLKASNGGRVKKLIDGDDSDYTSQSEADLALCCHLAFWTGKDPERIDRLFRASGLFRDKWDRKHHGDGATYGQETIRRAIERTTETYSASKPTNDGRLTPKDETGSLSSDYLLQALDRNEDGDAALFIELHQGRFVYDHSGGCWYVFRDHHWHEDTTDQALAAVQGVIELYGVEAKKQAECRLEAEKTAQKEQAQRHGRLEEALLKRIRQLQGLKRKTDVLKLAATDWSAQGRPSLALTGEEWDRDPMLLGCSNGVIDLTSGEHRPGRPTDYIKTFATTPWLGLDAPAPLWAKFLAEIFAGDQELVGYSQGLFGYGVTGKATEHILPIFHGPHGRNGKGTLLETVGRVLGEIAGPIEAEMLLLQTPETGRRADKRHYGPQRSAFSLGERDRRGEAPGRGKLKWLTGGETLTGRAPYGKRQVSFPPTHKVILLTNHKPHAPASDDALWARLHLIPFSQSFVDDPTKPNEHKRDAFLLEKLAREASGILAWFVRGCLLWQREGLKPPKTVLTASADYRREEDLIGHFLSDCYVIEKNAEAPAGKTYTAYQKWCTEMGHKPMSGTKFGTNLKERFDSYEDRRGVFYIGLGLRETDFAEEGG